LSHRRARVERDRWVGLAFMGPASILLVLAVGIPLIVAVGASMTNETLVSVEPREFIGGANYLNGVFTWGFISSVGVTSAIILGSLVIQFPIGLALALLLVQPLKGKQIL